MADRGEGLSAALHALAGRAAGRWSTEACGVTRAQTPIPALVHRDAYGPGDPGVRVLLLGGLSGQQHDVHLVLQALEAYLATAQPLANSVALSAVPCGNPTGLALGVGPENGAGGRPDAGYPPVDNFFYDAHNPEQRYLWRWVGMQAPDLVLELRAGPAVAWEASATAAPLAVALQAQSELPPATFLAALGTGTPNGLAPIPGLRLTTPPEALPAQLQRLWSLLLHTLQRRPAPARQILAARRARTPLAIARLLATVYGHTLDPVVYTQGMAISGRLYLAQLDPSAANPAPEIVRLVAPYVSGAKPLFTEPAATAALAGLTWGFELAEVAHDRRYADLVLGVAERYRADAAGGAPPPSDPDFRTEDMCMNGLMLGRAFRLTGNPGYLDLQTQFLLAARVQQDNGLFWHCRSAPYYWGRGNGFAALGFCETLSVLPSHHPHRSLLLAQHLRHLEALRQRQLLSGMYPQVLDVPGSYQEFTVTCMLGYAMARGIRQGWLGASYRTALERAWQGVTERIDATGGLVDCCTNTGVQTSLQAYIDRPALFGRDDRGGAMALWFALEMERLQRAQEQ
jgi:unsaturated rhamnogalacturonyl hydrolase